MISGPSAAPALQLACSQLTSRGEKRSAAYTLMPASIAPAPSPATRAKPSSIGQAVAAA